MSDKMATMKEMFFRLWAMLSAIFMFFTGVIQGHPDENPTAELVDEKQYVLEEAYLVGQGLATDGEYFYTSGAMSSVYMAGLGKIDMQTGEFVEKNLFALDSSFITKGYDHIGGIACYDGKIYAPVEDKDEKYPLVLIYDAQTLEYTGTYFDCTTEYLDDGIPWCAVDYDNGYLYTSQFHGIEYIVAYNLSDMSFSHIITLSEPIDRSQAGAYYDGKLYLNLDTKSEDKTKRVVTVDVSNGQVTELFTRNTSGNDTETEGFALSIDAEGNILYHIADYDKTVAVFLRTYKLG